MSLEVYLAARRHRFEYVRTLDELLGADGVVLSPVMAADAIPAEGRRMVAAPTPRCT